MSVIIPWEQVPLFKLLYKEPVFPISLSTQLDLPNQRVIRCDVDRTRADDLTQPERHLLEQMLTLYCKETGITYKQGMNEISAPFLLMCRDGMPEYIAYYCFKEFINACLKTMFEDETFRPLQVLFRIMTLLLKYHMPELSNLLKENDICPELYSTSWFLTVYATKVASLSMLYSLWEEILIEKDCLFICYIAVAFLEKYQGEIIGKEHLVIPSSLGRISIKNQTDLYKILERSRYFKKTLPVTISKKLNNFEVFNLRNIDSYTQALSKLNCLPIHPREVVHLVYPEFQLCADEGECLLCSAPYPILIIDCRSTEEQMMGHFPNTTFFEGDTSGIDEFPQQFEGLKGIYHFALLGSGENADEERVDRKLKAMLEAFIRCGFPYVSVVEGGYNSCHEFALHFKIPIKGHNPLYCKLCNSKKKLYVTRYSENESVKEKLKANMRILKSFECKVYNSRLKKGETEVIYLNITPEQIVVTDVERNIIESFMLKDLIKITTMKKVLVFEYSGLNEKKYYSFNNSNYADKCMNSAAIAFRSLKNGVISSFS